MIIRERTIRSVLNGQSVLLLSQLIFRLGDDGNGKYLIFGPGAHRIRSPFYNIADTDVSIMTPVIMHGTWTIVTVRERSYYRMIVRLIDL